MIYFDAAATSFQKPPEVARAVSSALRRCASVGRGGYSVAREAAKTVYECRKKAAELFEAETEQVVFPPCSGENSRAFLRCFAPSGKYGASVHIRCGQLIKFQSYHSFPHKCCFVQ